MKLYLSSIHVPCPQDLAELIGKPLNEVSVAIIPNAQDYYSERARSYKNNVFGESLATLGMKTKTIDLREYKDQDELLETLRKFDLIWARGGNTFCLRYEMRRSGFENIIEDLLALGIVYGGDSAGAFVASPSIDGVNEGDDTEYFAEEVINEGLNLVPYVVIPHVDNPAFIDIANAISDSHDPKEVIRLKDNQAVIFDGEKHRLIEAI